MQKLLSVRETSERAGISEALLYKLLRRGEGPQTIKLGRRTLIAESDGEAWITAKRSESAGKIAA